VRIALVHPALAGAHGGNQTTALRWERLLRELGHAVERSTGWEGGGADLLVALHARKSAAAVRRFRELRPGRPVVVALAGTDLDDLAADPGAAGAVAAADRLVALQPLAARAVPAAARGKLRVIRQSAVPPPAAPAPAEDRFEAALLAHVREVKDPRTVWRATRRLPEGARLVVRHAGAALDPALAAEAAAESARNARYRWLGPLPPDEAARLLASSRLLVVPSRAEGGANVVSEAIAAGVPILATRIPGSVGLLGEDHPGLFAPGDADGLAALLARAESDPGFLAALRRRGERLRPLVDPDREREAWRDLLAELVGPGGPPAS